MLASSSLHFSHGGPYGRSIIPTGTLNPIKMKSRPFCLTSWPQDLTAKLSSHYKFVSMNSPICKNNAIKEVLFTQRSLANAI